MIGKIIGFLFIIGYLLVIALFLFGIPLFFIIYSLKIVKDKEKRCTEKVLAKVLYKVGDQLDIYRSELSEKNICA